MTDENVQWTLCSALTSPASREEFIYLVKLSLPISLTIMQLALQTTITLLASGRIGTDLFNAASLSTTFLSIVGRAVFNGVGCACDTFFPQSYGSADKKKLGIWLQRSILLILLTCLPISILLWNAESILMHLGQNEDDARNAGILTKLYLLGLPDRVLPSLTIASLSNGLYLALLVVFRDTGDVRYVVIGISFSISNIAGVCLQVLYINTTQMYEETWNGFTIQSLKDWGHLVMVAVPSIAMQLLRTGIVHTLTFTAGYLGGTQLSAYSVGDNIWSMADKISLGISTATVVRLGTKLGAGQHHSATTCLVSALTLECIVSMSLATAVCSLSSQIPLLYNVDSDVCLLSAKMLKILSALLVLESIEHVILACYRAVGQQLFGAIMNLVVCLFVGLPVALVLMLVTSLGAMGGWFGHLSTAALMVFIGTVRFWNTDWAGESTKARERLAMTHPSEKIDKERTGLLENARRDMTRGSFGSD